MLVLACWMAGATATASPPVETPGALAADSSAAKSPSPPTVEEQWGIRVVRVCLSGAGNVVDFRYQVLDPEKAEALTNRSSSRF
jgi:hypothetical protein